jgi:hypothetical protein
MKKAQVSDLGLVAVRGDQLLGASWLSQPGGRLGM